MLRHLWVATKMMVIVIVVLGIAYPLVILGVSQVAFPAAANGSIVNVGGQPAGSALIAQGFSSPKYFWSRPSAAGAGWEASASAGSNLGPTSKTLFDTVQGRVASATVENPGLTTGTVPVDMVTSSGSGLDPDISVANALAQAPRVAQARRTACPRSDARVPRRATCERLHAQHCARRPQRVAMRHVVPRSGIPHRDRD